jgi:predicted metal-dependent HD superfamily phosphohydrolase
MSATKTAEAATAMAEVYRVRDELAQSYNPANALERMLVSQMAQSWLRLQRAQAAEARYFETRDVIEAITGDFERYKAITRYVADCERAWRHAMLQLEKVQRRRQQTDRSSPNARRRQSSPLVGPAVAQASACDAQALSQALSLPVNPSPPVTLSPPGNK